MESFQKKRKTGWHLHKTCSNNMNKKQLKLINEDGSGEEYIKSVEWLEKNTSENHIYIHIRRNNKLLNI